MSISPFLNNIQTHKDLRMCFNKLRKLLTKDFGFSLPHYYLTLSIGMGIALGTSLGITLGVHFDNGIVFGPIIGSGIGIIGGLIFGTYMDN